MSGWALAVLENPLARSAVRAHRCAMSPGDLVALIHLAGFSTGALLYGMLAIMTRRRLANVHAPIDRAADRIPLAAALLGLLWNVGAMVVFAERDFGLGVPRPWVSALAFSSLGMLPAVVVHTFVLRSQSAHRWLLGAAYLASLIAAVQHAAAASRAEMASPTGLRMLTVVYVAVLAIVAITERRKPEFRRSIIAIALAAFAVSALHMSTHTGMTSNASWPIELLGHHASLPLVLAILYQDYRFAFFDLFLKRALSVLALVGVVSLLYASCAAPLVDPHGIASRYAMDNGSHVVATALLLILWISTALVYPVIQRGVFRFVDRVVLRRADYRELRQQVDGTLAASQTAQEALEVGRSLVARTLGAATVTWFVSDNARTQSAITLNAGRTTARMAVPTAIDRSYEMMVDMQPAGRSLLSDDIMVFDAVAGAVARRIDELHINAERAERQHREDELRQLTTEAELRALRTQLNPHFLFNALTTLGHLMQAAPDRALSTLYRLTALLRAVLRRTSGQFVSLSDELEIVEAYLAIERERFEERLQAVIDVPPELRGVRIPPLVLQPLVENAIKHGISPKREGGTVTVRAQRMGVSARGAHLLSLVVQDSGIGFPATENSTGVGLRNIHDRLQHYFGEDGVMNISRSAQNETVVEIRMPISMIDAGGSPRSSERPT